MLRLRWLIRGGGASTCYLLITIGAFEWFARWLFCEVGVADVVIAWCFYLMVSTVGVFNP